MCLLIASRSGQCPPKEVCENASKVNDDGFGIAFPSKTKKSVIILKWATMDIEGQYKILQSISRKGPYIAHWRYGTSGPNNQELAHPFQVSDVCAFAHNGVMSSLDLIPGKSDTATLVEWFKKAGIRTIKETVESIKKIPTNILGGNKFAAISNDGEVEIHGEAVGTWKDGVWYSNTGGFGNSSIKDSCSTTATTTSYKNGNYTIGYNGKKTEGTILARITDEAKKADSNGETTEIITVDPQKWPSADDRLNNASDLDKLPKTYQIR